MFVSDGLSSSSTYCRLSCREFCSVWNCEVLLFYKRYGTFGFVKLLYQKGQDDLVENWHMD